jgi:hypothetical protein
MEAIFDESDLGEYCRGAVGVCERVIVRLIKMSMTNSGETGE